MTWMIAVIGVLVMGIIVIGIDLVARHEARKILEFVKRWS